MFKSGGRVVIDYDGPREVSPLSAPPRAPGQRRTFAAWQHLLQNQGGTLEIRTPASRDDPHFKLPAAAAAFLLSESIPVLFDLCDPSTFSSDYLASALLLRPNIWPGSPASSG